MNIETLCLVKKIRQQGNILYDSICMNYQDIESRLVVSYQEVRVGRNEEYLFVAKRFLFRVIRLFWN